MTIDFSKLDADVVQMFAFGKFKALTDEKTQGYIISFIGSNMTVPVSKEEYQNPPEFGQCGVVRGILETTRYGRPVGNFLEWHPVKKEDFPKLGESRMKFEGACIVDKQSYGREGDKSYNLILQADDFMITSKVDEETFNRFPTGLNPVYGEMKFDQRYNKQYGAWVTYCQCVPLGVVQQKRAPKPQQ